MEKIEKFKIPLIFFVISLITIPIINEYIKLIEESLKINVTNVTFIIIWAIVNGIIALTTENIILTKKNSKIEVEGINLKRKDGTYGTADWGTREEIEEYLSINKRNGIIVGQTEQNELITLPLHTYLNKNIAVFRFIRQ